MVSLRGRYSDYMKTSDKINSKNTCIIAPWPFFDTDEIDAAQKVLSSGRVNYWTGDEGRLFEHEFAEYLGAKHAIALSNGTIALETALHALDIGPGDEVIVPCRTFIATASAIVARGAKPVIADIDLASQNITTATIQPHLTQQTKAIVCVHLAGLPCEMDSLLNLAKQNGLYVIEDCAQAIGAEFRGKKVGTFGDIAAFSFCQDKIITTAGEGGMAVTDNAQLWKKMWGYKDHGKNYDLTCNSKHDFEFRWIHENFGTNGRMTEMQAAIRRIQLKKLNGWLARRRKHAAMLDKCFEQIPYIIVTRSLPHLKHAYYKYYAFLLDEVLPASWSRNRIIQTLNSYGVPCFTGGCGEIYREQAFVKAGFSPKNRFPKAKQLSESSLMFLVHPTITDEQMQRMCEVILDVFKAIY